MALDDSENQENLQWIIPSIRNIPEITPAKIEPTDSTEPHIKDIQESIKQQRKRKHDQIRTEKIQRQRMKVRKRAKILFE